MSTETQEQTQAATPGMEAVKFHFKEKKENGIVVEPKRASLEASIPVASAQSIVDIIFSETETDERKEKLLTYLARLHNEAAYKAAQAQITAKLASFATVAERVAYTLTAADLDITKLDIWTLAYTEPAQRGGTGKQFSDELVAEVSTSFIEFGAITFKKADGNPVSREGLVKTADEIFKNRFRNTKTDKRTLNVFKERLTLWFAGLDAAKQAGYQAFTENLMGRIENYLNPSVDSTIGKFE